MAGGVAVIRVSGASDVDVKQHKDRLDDSLHAIRAAIEEGIVPGGGVALARASLILPTLAGDNDDQRVGIEIVRKALQLPLCQIAENAGEDGAVIAGKVLDRDDYNWGFDAQTGEFKDMVEAGIIDPTKVVRTALQNAASVGSLMLTSEALAVQPSERPGSSSRRMLRGVDRLGEAVKVALGPKGRKVVLDKSFGAPRITKDGVSVAKEIELADKFENMGAQMVREVASKTNDIAGDGTTTATVLAQSIVREGSKAVGAGMNPTDLKLGIEKAVRAVVEELKTHSRKITTPTVTTQIGTISANGETDIGKIIAEAMLKVGNAGVIVTVGEVSSGDKAAWRDTTSERTVRWFNSPKGHGFSQQDEGSKDVFVHLSAVERSGLGDLTRGQDVTFDLDPGQLNRVATDHKPAADASVGEAITEAFVHVDILEREDPLLGMPSRRLELGEGLVEDCSYEVSIGLAGLRDPRQHGGPGEPPSTRPRRKPLPFALP